MIKIKKGSQILKVSKCSYNDTFKKLGYIIVNENSKEEVSKNTSSNENKKTNEKIKEEIIDNGENPKSSDLNVNIMGEKNQDFSLEDNKKDIESKSTFEKILSEKSNKPKGK